MSEQLESLIDLIVKLKHDACSKVIAVVLDHLKNEGFTVNEFLNGLANYFDGHNYDETVGYLEQAAASFHRESKAKIERAIALTEKSKQQ